MNLNGRQDDMQKRFVTIWFCHLLTDWFTIRRPLLKDVPFVIVAPDHGCVVITAANTLAEDQGITAGTLLADAKAIVPGLQVFDDKPGRNIKLLKGLGEWCIRYTPIIAIDPTGGLILEVSGCTHLRGGEVAYLNAIVTKLSSKGYHVQAAIADTIGAAWAVSRLRPDVSIVKSGDHIHALMPLSVAGLRLEPLVVQRLYKLGLYQVNSIINMPRSVLRRRFGEGLLLRLDQATGREEEIIKLLQPILPFEERLPCMEPIRTVIAIEIAIKHLLETLCKRLQAEGKGVRTAILRYYRIDGKVKQVEIGTNRATHNTVHLFKLLQLQITAIEPALGIELFILETPKVEDVPLFQEALWAGKPGLNDQAVVELLDRLAGKVGTDKIHRYLPDEHYWPERSIKKSASLQETPTISWCTDRPRPTQLLTIPERIEVTAPIPDYPPMLFVYQNKRHHVKKADGPERIEREWWLEAGEHRDYYIVEDEQGNRYWLFRSGHYTGDQSKQWFIHGFFA